jgi:hypothetical protein
MRSVACDERAAITLAAGDVEDDAAGDHRRDEMIAMPMLVPDLTGGPRDKALTGERKRIIHAGNSTRAARSGSVPTEADGRTAGRNAAAMTMNMQTIDQWL